MASKAGSIDEYLASLPDERRQVIEAVRKVIRANLDSDFEEGIQYGMIGYYIPHRVFPAGYHCDPKQPLPYAALAAQKNHFSLHLMGLYISPRPMPKARTRRPAGSDRPGLPAARSSTWARPACASRSSTTSRWRSSPKPSGACRRSATSSATRRCVRWGRHARASVGVGCWC